MKSTKLKQTLRQGGRVFGCMLSATASTRWAGALSGSTLDYVIIDTEHSSRDRTEIQTLCSMLRQVDITPVVRVPIPKKEWVAMALDAGAAGILVPYVETIEEVEAVTATARWHPMKGEYLMRAVRENKFPSSSSKKYLKDRHKGTFVILGIESEPAYNNLDAILDAGKPDGIFIGPNDMSTSLGVPNEYDNPVYLDVGADIIRRCEERGIPVMVHQQNIQDSATAIELGARFVLHSTDTGILQRAIKTEMNRLREISGVDVLSSKDGVAVV